MDCKEELLRNLAVIMQDSEVPAENLNYARNKILLALDKYEISLKCTDLAVIDTESDKYIKLYLAMMRMEGKSERTIEAYGYLLNRYKNSIDLPVVEMDTMAIRIWLAKMQQTVSMSTTKTFRSYLCSFYTWLAREKIIGCSPMAAVEPIKTPQNVKRPFNDVEIDKLRSACTTLRDRAILETLMACGARVSELCALDKADIDLGSKTVIIRNGKGAKQRIVYINDVCREHLMRYFAERNDDFPWAFSTARNTRMSVGTAERALKKIGQRANVVKVHPHKCRRTFATSLSKKGMDLSSLQILMGHSDTNTTRQYVTLNQEYIQNQYSRYA